MRVPGRVRTGFQRCQHCTPRAHLLPHPRTNTLCVSVQPPDTCRAQVLPTKTLRVLGAAACVWPAVAWPPHHRVHVHVCLMSGTQVRWHLHSMPMLPSPPEAPSGKPHSHTLAKRLCLHCTRLCSNAMGGNGTVRHIPLRQDHVPRRPQPRACHDPRTPAPDAGFHGNGHLAAPGPVSNALSRRAPGGHPADAIWAAKVSSAQSRYLLFPPQPRPLAGRRIGATYADRWGGSCSPHSRGTCNHRSAPRMPSRAPRGLLSHMSVVNNMTPWPQSDGSYSMGTRNSARHPSTGPAFRGPRTHLLQLTSAWPHHSTDTNMTHAFTPPRLRMTDTIYMLISHRTDSARHSPAPRRSMTQGVTI